MKLKAKLKIAIDLIMTILLLFLMGFQFCGEELHEWAGALMFLLFIVHHFLNYNWYKTLLKGKYHGVRIFQVTINILLFITMVALMVSGMIMSSYVFAFIDFQGSLSLARILHIAGSYWGFVLMSMHIGLHWSMIASMIKKQFKLNVNKIVSYLLAIIIVIYGIYVFIKRDFLTYMLLQSQFVFLDFNESKLLFYLDYLVLMEVFGILSYQTMKLLKTKRSKED